MNGANNYNMCPRCGNSNPLTAKYCSRCGEQLRVPEEPVVCHKCHTHNSPVANFCRNCGAELKVGLETKICPKCGKEVDAHDNVCTCGYSFVGFDRVDPSATPVPATPVSVTDKAKGKKERTRGGRAWAIFAFILLLALGYYLFAPIVARPAVLTNLDHGATYDGTAHYGYDYILGTVKALKGLNFVETYRTYGLANVILDALYILTALTVVIQLIVLIVRIFTTKRSKHANWYYFVMLLISGIGVGLIFLFNKVTININFLHSVAEAFRLPSGTEIGWAALALPAYYLIFFFVSLGARLRKKKDK